MIYGSGSMRIVISVDMEGASGVARERETGYPRGLAGDPEATPDYLTARKWLTADVNAAVEGAIEAGATSFVLHDSHGSDRRNVVLDELHPAVEVVRGMPVVFYDYRDLGSSFDAAFMIAMHARAGEAGIISHVLDWPLMQDVRLNGESVGEAQITAALAGYYGIPTVLVTGDNLICEEYSQWVKGEVETAVVKHSLSRYAVRCLPLETARKRIREAAFRAVKRVGDIRPISIVGPVSLEVAFASQEIAWYVSWMPAVEYDGARTVCFRGDDMLSVYKALLAMYWIGSNGVNP
jgi:D-amino peptidase